MGNPDIEYFDFVVSEKGGFNIIFKDGDESLFKEKLDDIRHRYDRMEITPQTDEDDDDSYIYRYGKRKTEKEYHVIRLK